MAAKKKVPAKKESAEVALPFDFMADVGAGMEGTDKDSFAIPFLRVLQPLSPQVTDGDPEYVEGAKAGMLFNSVTGKCWDGKAGVKFMPCVFQRRFLQWAPRNSDGGFGGEYLPEDVVEMKSDGKAVELDGRLYLADEDGKVDEKKSDILVDTRSHFGIVIDEEGESASVLLPLSSTQIKKSKQLMSILNTAKVNGVTPPTWMNSIKLTTVLESNDQGSWYGVRFEADGFIDSKELYDAGKAFYEAIASGEAKASYDPEEEKTDDKF